MAQSTYSLTLAGVRSGVADRVTISGGGVPLNAGGGGNGDELAVSGWFKWASSATDQALVMEEPTNSRWLLFIQSGNLIWRAGTTIVGGTDVVVTAPTAGIWHHIACNLKNFISGVQFTLSEIWVDGIKVADGGPTDLLHGTMASYFTHGTGDIVFGALQDLGIFYYVGGQDDIALFNRILTSTEIAGIYAGTTDVSTLSPVGLWRMEEGSGTTTADSSGNGNTATITGATWSTDVPTPLAGSPPPPPSTYTTTAGLAVGSSTLAAVATFAKPIYTAAAALVAHVANLASVATFTKPNYHATATLTSAPATLVASATFTKPIYTAAGSLSVGHPTLTASVIAAVAVYSTAATLTAGHATLAAVTTFTKPTYQAAGTLTAAVAILAATAIGPSLRIATATLTVGHPTLLATATGPNDRATSAALATGRTTLAAAVHVTNTVYSATAGLVVGSTVLSGSASTAISRLPCRFILGRWSEETEMAGAWREQSSIIGRVGLCCGDC